MPKFREGERVIGLGMYEGRDLANIGGTIRAVDGDICGVVWDKNVGGHDMLGRCSQGFGWWVHEDLIDFYNLSLENK